MTTHQARPWHRYGSRTCLIAAVIVTYAAACESRSTTTVAQEQTSGSDETAASLECEGREECRAVARRLLEEVGAVHAGAASADSELQPSGGSKEIAPQPEPSADELAEVGSLEDPLSAAADCVLGATEGATPSGPTSGSRRPETLPGVVFEMEAKNIARAWHYRTSPVIEENTNLRYAFQYDPHTGHLGVNPALVAQQLGDIEHDASINRRAWTLAVAGSAAHEMGHYYIGQQHDHRHTITLMRLVSRTWPAWRADVPSQTHQIEILADAFAGCHLAETWEESRPLSDFFGRFVESTSHPEPGLRTRAISAGVLCQGNSPLDSSEVTNLREGM